MKKLFVLLMTVVLCCVSCLAGAESEKKLPEAYEQVLDMVKKGMAGDPDTLENRLWNDSVSGWVKMSDMIADYDNDAFFTDHAAELEIRFGICPSG